MSFSWNLTCARIRTLTVLKQSAVVRGWWEGVKMVGWLLFPVIIYATSAWLPLRLSLLSPSPLPALLWSACIHGLGHCSPCLPQTIGHGWMANRSHTALKRQKSSYYMGHFHRAPLCVYERVCVLQDAFTDFWISTLSLRWKVTLLFTHNTHGPQRYSWPAFGLCVCVCSVFMFVCVCVSVWFPWRCREVSHTSSEAGGCKSHSS